MAKGGAKKTSDNGAVEPVMVTQGVPPVDVVVNEGVVIVHGEQQYTGGDTIKDVDGPQAMNWEASGYVTIQQ